MLLRTSTEYAVDCGETVSNVCKDQSSGNGCKCAGTTSERKVENKLKNPVK